MGEMFGQALIGSHKESEKTARKFIKAIDREKLQRAKNIFSNLKQIMKQIFIWGDVFALITNLSIFH